MADGIAALDCAFTAEDEGLISGLVTPGHAATPGHDDPACRIEDRPVSAHTKSLKL